MRILLADDEPSVRRVFQFKLEQQGHEVVTASDGEQAWRALESERFDVLVSDIRMPKLDGIALLERVRAEQPALKMILMTAHATVAQAVEAVKLGAFDYITKPFEDDELLTSIEKARAFRELEEENRRLRGRLEARDAEQRLIGVSAAFRELMQLVERVAQSDATVLLSGPSGTGKELVARTIHARSDRAGSPFVGVNCGAIPHELIESELFGHVRGAFTGATRDKRGRFEQADGGTLLLDEIGDLAPGLQVKLLRVLQERVVEPVGSERGRAVDVRVIAATNVDLQARVAVGQFREDLFYRLNVIPIAVPSLSERRDDIPVLARAFAEREEAQVRIDDALMARLTGHNWPGNVRELENLVQRMIVLRRADHLTLSDLPDDFGRTPGPTGMGTSDSAEAPTYHAAEEALVRRALEKTGWNQSRAARLLDIPRHVLIYRIKKYGLAPPIVDR